ncbi:hypothetical protein K525DRAFT_210944 [Schizophyllum commune Loenen D]|nr:hypothetical protein K525DRAFT_210944 [Schizophyllum commune Loenen D]
MVIDAQDDKAARKAAYREAKKQARLEKQASKKRDVQNRRTLRALEGQQQALDDVLLDVPSDRVLPIEERSVEVGEASRYLVEDAREEHIVGPKRHRLAGRMNASPYGAALAEKRSRRKY